jgi:HD-GYP domain-containing protein (c-di-GMP phosphodiesterase class II)
LLAGAAASGAPELIQTLRRLLIEHHDALRAGDRQPAPVPARREADGTAAAALAISQTLDHLHAAMGLVLREHEGMAEELLRAYEQIGILFEVTRRLSEVRSEDEVVRLFIDSLRRAYPHVRFGIVSEDGLRHRRIEGGEIDYAPGLEQAIRDARSRRCVVVENLAPRGADASLTNSAGGQILVGPVYAGDSFVCALILASGAMPSPPSAAGAAGVGPGRSATSPVPPAAPRAFDSSDMLLLDTLSLFCGDLIRNFRLLRELRQLSMDMVRALVGAVDQKDSYTSGHSHRVGCYARLLGEDLGLDEMSLQMLEWSALLHDVGKIGIRDEVLKKSGRLTPEEFAHMKEHPVRSYEVVRGVPQLSAALDGVLHHHEHYDGSGYPHGLAGEQIPLQARLIQIADVFDALTTSRSYRQAFDWQHALEIIRREAGTTLDPRLSERFDRLICARIADDPQALAKLVSRGTGREGVPIRDPSAVNSDSDPSTPLPPVQEPRT